MRYGESKRNLLRNNYVEDIPRGNLKGKMGRLRCADDEDVSFIVDRRTKGITIRGRPTTLPSNLLGFEVSLHIGR